MLDLVDKVTVVKCKFCLLNCVIRVSRVGAAALPTITFDSNSILSRLTLAHLNSSVRLERGKSVEGKVQEYYMKILPLFLCGLNLVPNHASMMKASGGPWHTCFFDCCVHKIISLQECGHSLTYDTKERTESRH